MDEVGDHDPTEPGILRAAWRRRWLVTALTVLFGALGFAYASLRPPEYVATAALVVRDPRTSGVFETGGGLGPERYVADQVEIFRSLVVAEQAARLSAEQDRVRRLSVEDFRAGTSVSATPGTDLIHVQFRAPGPTAAEIGANLLIDAYVSVRRSEAAVASASALEQLDASMEAITDELRRLEARIDEASGPESQQALPQILREIDRLREEILATNDPDRLQPLQIKLAALTQHVQALQAAESLEQQQPQLSALLQAQQEAIERRAELAARRDQIRVDAELMGSGVVVASPAGDAFEAPFAGGAKRTTALAAGFGLLLGVGLAYELDLRRRSFSGSSQPQVVLDSHLLAEIPDFSEEGLSTPLPQREASRSASAEAIRFAATALEAQREPSLAKSLIVLSPVLGDGKSTVLANTALATAAAAADETRLLVVDADFGTQALTGLLLGSERPPYGLTDLALADIALEEAVSPVGTNGRGSLHLLARGSQPVVAPEFFQTMAARRALEMVREKFDLILIDAPPFLQVAYAGAIARYADAAVVIVRHGSDIGELRELADRLALVGTPIAGYIYNLGPLHRRMTKSEGSMKDVLMDRRRPGLVGRMRHRVNRRR